MRAQIEAVRLRVVLERGFDTVKNDARREERADLLLYRVVPVLELALLVVIAVHLSESNSIAHSAGCVPQHPDR